MLDRKRDFLRRCYDSCYKSWWSSETFYLALTDYDVLPLNLLSFKTLIPQALKLSILSLNVSTKSWHNVGKLFRSYSTWQRIFVNALDCRFAISGLHDASIVTLSYLAKYCVSCGSWKKNEFTECNVRYHT